jgi:DNA repair exonuclease SbcCD ATPase subunit
MTPKSVDSSGLGSGISVAGLVGGNALSVDVKVSQLAERVSLLVAGVQRQSCHDKQDLERQLSSFSCRAETRLANLEARFAVVEEQTSGRDRDRPNREEDALSADSRIMREVRALVAGAVTEVQASWRTQRAELMDGQQEQARQLEELSEHTKRGATRLQEVQIAFEGLQENLDLQAKNLQHTETELRTLLSRGNGTPPWYGELEASVARLEHRVDEQRSAAEHQINRFRTDAESLRLRLEGLREDALCAVDRRIDVEIDRLMSQRTAPYPEHRSDKDLHRRLDESEARIAALRVRIDAHDSRFSALGERAEAACQRALEDSRQAVGRQKDEIMQEVEWCCSEITTMRQKIEAIGDVCEELSLPAYGPMLPWPNDDRLF